jgi:hypothetical protein
MEYTTQYIETIAFERTFFDGISFTKIFVPDTFWEGTNSVLAIF